MEQLQAFSAGSANDSHQLWLKGAGQIISQLNRLLDKVEYKFEILNIDEYKIDGSTLQEILTRNGSDKALLPWHNYHTFYAHVFNLLGVNSKLNILEIGLGTNNPDLPSTMGPLGKPGASLYSWREYLPNSKIYGADIDRDILFESERIKTFYVDQLDVTTFSNIPDIKYDLIIDDGLHSIGANLNTLLFGLDHLSINGWLIIEDIHITENWKVVDFILKSKYNYKTYMVSAVRGCLYAVNKC